MKTLIQLLIVALIANAGFQAAHSYYNFYSFRDEVHTEVLNGNYNLSSEMHQRFVDLGKARGLDVNYDSFEMSKLGDLTIVEFKYVDDVAFVPRAYSRKWPYQGRVSVHRMKQLKWDEEEYKYQRR